jgi:hypothetical protein
MSVAASATTDRGCRSCQLGVTFRNSSLTRCQNTTQCPADQIEIFPPTLSVDRVCALCPPGMFKNMSTHQCQNVSICQAGTYTFPWATTSTDAVCTACAPGSFQQMVNQSTCVLHTDCGPGSFVSFPPTRFSDRKCVSCPFGYYQDEFNQPSCRRLPGACALNSTTLDTARSELLKWDPISGKFVHAQVVPTKGCFGSHTFQWKNATYLILDSAAADDSYNAYSPIFKACPTKLL